MSRKYKFYNPEGLYFVSFATVNWIDVFTRMSYRDIVVSSLNYCVKEKGLVIYAWVIMSNPILWDVHAAVGGICNPDFADYKDFQSAIN